MPTAVSLALWTALVLARSDTRAEASLMIDRFIRGEVSANGLANRINYLGEQPFATAELLRQLGRVPVERKRAQFVEAVALLAPPGHEEAARLLLSTLDDADVSLRLSAIKGLARMKYTEALKPLVALLGDRSSTVRLTAATALGQLKVGRAAGPLLDAAAREDELETRLSMLAAVGKTGNRAAVPRLEKLLGDSSESTRLVAAQALCALGSKKGTAFAARLIGSADRGERLSGVRLLEDASLATARTTLKPALEDIDPRVRATAGRILVQAGDQARLAWLVIESSRALGDDRLPFEEALEALRLSDEDRQAILRKAGLK